MINNGYSSQNYHFYVTGRRMEEEQNRYMTPVFRGDFLEDFYLHSSDQNSDTKAYLQDRLENIIFIPKTRINILVLH